MGQVGESISGRRCFFFNDTATTEIYTLSLHDALPISGDDVVGAEGGEGQGADDVDLRAQVLRGRLERPARSEEHTSELQSRQYLVCRLLLEKKPHAPPRPAPPPLPVIVALSRALRSTR